MKKRRRSLTRGIKLQKCQKIVTNDQFQETKRKRGSQCMFLKSTNEKKGYLFPRGAQLQECTKYIEVTIVCKKNQIANNKLQNTKFVRKKKNFKVYLQRAQMERKGLSPI